MKTRIFLGMGLLVSAMGFGQTLDTTIIAPNTPSSGKANVLIGIGTSGPPNPGSTNVVMGASAGNALSVTSDTSTASHNVYIGANSGQNNAIGNDNVFVGYNAGRDSSGKENTFLGPQAGYYATGNRNIFIGRQAGKYVTTGNDLLYIDNTDRSNPLIYGNLDSDFRELKFNAKKVGIGFEGTTGNEGFGNFPVGSTIPNIADYRLFVRGGILAYEVRVRLETGWPDYVFAKDYNLLSLKDTEKYILENGHLPNMPSAEQVKAEGVELGNIVTLQQEKIEELTLHLIEQDKQIEELKAQVQLLLNK